MKILNLKMQNQEQTSLPILKFSIPGNNLIVNPPDKSFHAIALRERAASEDCP
jgi:hypothetical protein